MKDFKPVHKTVACDMIVMHDEPTAACLPIKVIYWCMRMKK